MDSILNLVRITFNSSFSNLCLIEESTGVDEKVIFNEIKDRWPRSKIIFVYYSHLKLSNGRNTYKQQQHFLREIKKYN